MSRPFRRFCFALAEKLGKSVTEVLAFSSAELTEWMGYCLTQNDKWLAEYNKQAELEAFNQLSPEEQADKFKAAFGAKK